MKSSAAPTAVLEIGVATLRFPAAQQNATDGNVSQRNALLREAHGPVHLCRDRRSRSAKLCKVLQNFADICRTKQRFVAAPGAPVSYAVNYSYDQLNRPTNANWSPAPAFTAPA